MEKKILDLEEMKQKVLKIRTGVKCGDGSKPWPPIYPTYGVQT